MDGCYKYSTNICRHGRAGDYVSIPFPRPIVNKQDWEMETHISSKWMIFTIAGSRGSQMDIAIFCPYQRHLGLVMMDIFQKQWETTHVTEKRANFFNSLDFETLLTMDPIYKYSMTWIKHHRKPCECKIVKLQGRKSFLLPHYESVKIQHGTSGAHLAHTGNSSQCFPSRNLEGQLVYVTSHVQNFVIKIGTPIWDFFFFWMPRGKLVQNELDSSRNSWGRVYI